MNFVSAAESGKGPIHFGAAAIEFQRNTAKAEARRSGEPYLIYIAIERWMPDGSHSVLREVEKE